MVAHIEAEYLFAPRVYGQLRDVWKKSCEFFALKSIMQHSYDTTGSYGDGNPAKERDFLLWLSDQLAHLSDLFGDELKMADEDQPITTEST